MRRALNAAALVLAGFASPALAQDATPAPVESASPAPVENGSLYDALEQIPLTDDQVKNYVASVGEMQKAMGDAPADASQPDPGTMAKLETVAKKYGFRNFNEYNTVAGNIAITLDGVNPETKTYVGVGGMIDRAAAQIEADKQMPDADRKATLAQLQAQKKATPALKYKSNIELVLKYYDQLSGG